MKKTLENIKRIFESEFSFRVLCGVGIVIGLLVVFCAGIHVGFRKASFDRAWVEHYYKNFVMMPAHMDFGMDYFPNAH